MRQGAVGGMNAMRHTKSDSGRHQRLIGVVLGAALSASPVLAYGLGLGRLVVESGLDEPLNAHVRIIGATPSDIKSLSPKLASRAVFAEAGVARHHFLSKIRYSISQHKDGNYYVDFSTTGPFNEPFIQTLLEVDWAGGQLVREYTALLDPPHWVASQHPAISAPTVTAAAQAPTVIAAAPTPTAAPAPHPEAAGAAKRPAQRTVAATAVAPETKKPLLGPASRTKVMAATAPQIPVAQASAVPAPGRRSTWANTTRYTVRKGDTLSGIAHRITADPNISPEQVMIALLQANPDAFFNHNVNDLISGKILKVPPRRQVLSVSRAQALKDFRLQYDAWQEYKLRLAAASKGMKVAGEGAQGVSRSAPSTAVAQAATKPTPAAPAQNAAAAQAAKPAAAAKNTAGDALLRIVRSELSAESAGGQAPNSAGPQSARKEAAGERAALSNKMTTLEEQIDARKEQNKELSEKVGKMRKQVRNTARLITVENRELALAEKKAAQPKPAVARPIVRRPLAPRPPIRNFVPAQPQSEGLIEGVLGGIVDNPLTLAMLGGVAVLGLGILAMYYVRRRRAKAEFEESILSGGSLAAEASSVTDSGSQAAASDTSFLSDFSQGGMGNIHTDEVDPIAEAEVYLAYGRDEQAEEILKEAVVKDPQRQELKQKLLEIYLQRNDIVAFETLAEELYAQIEGKGGRVWEKVEEMGRKISPNNPMFRGGDVPGREPVAATGEMETLRGVGEDTGPFVPLASGSVPEAQPEPAAEAAPEIGGIDFVPEPAPAIADSHPSTADTASVPAPEPADGISFDLDLSTMAAADAPASDTSEPQTVAPVSHANDGFGLDFTLDDAPTAGDAGDAGEIRLDTPTLSDNEPTLDFGATAPEAEEPRADEGMAFLADAVADAPALEFESAAESDVDGQSHWDETTTKLDLAKAYIDMGDSEGARSILDEVMAEGNESQKNQARELAAQIA